MTDSQKYFSSIEDPYSVITPIQSGTTFPESLKEKVDKYTPYINDFCQIVRESSSSQEVLERIRDRSIKMNKEKRMALLKIFRRCVSPVCDTEATKKINKIPTSVFIDNYGHTFKPIAKLKKQFISLTTEQLSALCVLLGEYDKRGEQGYVLTDLFFTWIEETFQNFSIEGPRGAGQDVQLSNVFPDFIGNYPCDFIIKQKTTNNVLAVGFARYDSTRGGAQSDDRTGGNSDKVAKAMQFSEASGRNFKLIFLADGPGLTHKDTWFEACELDGSWNGKVRVTTLITAPERITEEWLYLDSR